MADQISAVRNSVRQRHADDVIDIMEVHLAVGYYQSVEDAVTDTILWADEQGLTKLPGRFARKFKRLVAGLLS